MANTKHLDRATGAFFFCGAMIAKLQYLPFPLVAAAFRFFSLVLYLGAYGTWFASSYLQADQKQQHDKWYAFAKIKEQFLFSSLIGFIATVLSIAAIFLPILFPPAAWLFAIGNAIWAIGEYHKFKNPPDDPNYSDTKQKAYSSYTIATAAISVVAAIAATLLFIFPLTALPIAIVSLVICVGLGALAFEYWLNYTFGKHETKKNNNSYNSMDGLNKIPKETPSEEPTHHPNPIESFTDTKSLTPQPSQEIIKTPSNAEVINTNDIVATDPTITL